MLLDGWSRDVLAANIATEIARGRRRSQAIAIAYANARRSFRRAHPRKALPLALEPFKVRETVGRERAREYGRGHR